MIQISLVINDNSYVSNPFSEILGAKPNFVIFEVDYQVALIDNAKISFINYSERAEKYFWDFGNSLTSVEFEPQYTYTELGDYKAAFLAE